MDINRLIRICKRLNDFSYLQNYSKYFSRKIVIRSQLKQLREYHFGNIKDFTSLRDQKLYSHLKYVHAHSSFYREAIENTGFELSMANLKRIMNSLPILDKNIIKKEYDRILAIPSSKKYLGYQTTGGSTGEPFGFHVFGGYDAEHQEFFFKLMGYVQGDKILALDGSLVPEQLVTEGIYWIVKNSKAIPYGSMALSSHYLNASTIDKYIEFIRDFNPSIIRGYPSYIESLAKYILDNDINLGVNLKGIQLTSETFYDYQVSNISKAFQTKVYSQYGHAEASVFGYSLDEDMLIYCSPLYGYTEIIGEDGKHVEPGEIGEIIVTGFGNRALPFIRYKTGDLGLYNGEENGIVKLGKVFGRTQDIVYRDDMSIVRLTALVFGSHYKSFNHIEKWQIIQDIPGEVLFKIVKGPKFSDLDIDEIKRSFMTVGKIRTKFEIVDELPLTKRGKSKFLIQNIVNSTTVRL